MIVRGDVARADGCKREALYVQDDSDGGWLLESLYPLNAWGYPYVPACLPGAYAHFVEVEDNPLKMGDPKDPSAPLTRPNRTQGWEPRYPEDARRAGEEAVFIARCRLSAVGLLDCCDLEPGRGAVEPFEEEVRTSMVSWRYSPAVRAGEPIDVQFLHRFVFTLDDNFDSRTLPHIDGGVTPL